MSEHQAALAHTATAPAAVAARPRISADAFRNLTARLKKSDVQIPSLTPLAPAPVSAVAPPAAPEPVIAAAPVVAPDPVVPAPIVAPHHDLPATSLEPVASVETPVPAKPLLPDHAIVAPVQNVEIEVLEAVDATTGLELVETPVTAQSEPAFEAELATIASLQPIQFEQASEPVFEPIAELQVEPVTGLPLDPVAELHVEAIAAVQAEPASGLLQPVVLEPVLEPVTGNLAVPAFEVADQPPEVEPVAAIEVASFEMAAIDALPGEAPAVVDQRFPDLPEFVPPPVVAEQRFPDLPEFVPTPVPTPAPAAAEPALKGTFADNFTYVPEPGKDEAPKVDLADVGEAIKQEVAQRATELELENNWRLLLAKPTAEDRATYLREAAEYHAADDEWNKPAPEHDLSQIEPAAEAAIEQDAEYIPLADEPQPRATVERSLVDTLPSASGQDLSELSRSLLDMMAAGNSSGLPQERALAADTLLRIVPRLDLKAVMLLAQRLAMMDNPPHLLVTRLIRDTRVEVAGPLLEDCPHISDKDLESVVQEGEPDKLRLIARRRKLTRAISDVLIKSGEPSVVLTLVRNAEAEISHDGFESLLLLCENQPDLLAPLATRQDLSAPMAFEMFWAAPAQLRRFILSRFLTDSETLTKILKITLATNMGEEGEGEPLSQHAMLEALERAARGHTEVAAEELASLMQVSAATVTRILGDLAGEPLVIMLKAAGYPRSAVSGLLKRMQDADLPIISRERDVGELQSMFETLSFNKARILLTYWDWAQKKLGPYAPVH